MAWGRENRGGKRKFGGRGSPYGPAPRRGPPAIFVTCEAGREKKCQREVLELMHHYYYASRPSPSSLQQKEEEAKAPSNKEEEGQVKKQKKEEEELAPSDETKPLSLEEELSMLRKGAAAEEVISYDRSSSKRPRNGVSSNASMKSPFSIYDTGMRGMVCILCNLPDSELVPYADILAEIKASKEEKSDEQATTPNNETISGVDEATKDGEGGAKSVAKESIGSNEKESESTDPKSPGPPLWDPVESVKFIMRDAKQMKMSKDRDECKTDCTNDEEKNSESKETGTKDAPTSKELLASPPPGSRFILRILPMQATCFASIEEIKAVSTSLLKRFLPQCQSILAKDGKELTFKLEIKRRLCSHLKRDQILNAVTPVVFGMGDAELPGYKFSVNLGDPDFSVRVETCKSLCGISVLPREEWYGNFNLAELSNPSGEDDKPSASDDK